MSNCPNDEFVIKYLLLLVLLCSIAPTSSNAFFPTLNYLHSRMSFTKDETIANMAKVAFVRLMKSFARKRLYPPTDIELESILNVK